MSFLYQSLPHASHAESFISSMPATLWPKTGTRSFRAADQRSAGQLPLIPGAVLTAEVGRCGRADGDEPALRQDLLGRRVRVRDGRPERSQPMVRRQLAYFADGRRRHSAAGDVTRDPVTEVRSAIRCEEQIEPAQD